MHCANHPDIEATGTCVRCGRPLCGTCGITDLTTEEVICSTSCRTAIQPGGSCDEELLEGLEHPFALGWRLWRSALPVLTTQVAVPAAVVGAIVTPLLSGWGQPEPSGDLWQALLVVALAGLACAVVGALLTRTYLGAGTKGAIGDAVVRFPVWAGTVFAAFAVSAVGFLLFVIPGIYLSLRLFWADEFALAHGHDPWQALAASWRLTRDAASEVFSFQFKLGFAQAPASVAAMIILIATVNLLDATTLSATTGASISVAVAAFLLVLVYGFSHACEIVFFYALRADYSLFLAEQAASQTGEQTGGARAIVSSAARSRPSKPSREAADDMPTCPSCGTAFDPSDYRPGAAAKRCPACRADLPFPR